MQASKKRSTIRPKSCQNHPRERLEGPWGPIGTPSEKKVEKWRRQAPNSHPLLELFFVLLPKMGKPVFQRISGWSPNRLFEDAGGQKHQKGRSKRSLFETFSARAGFLKNVLPPTRELHSQGPAPPKSDSKWCVFCEIFVEGALNPHFCDFW